MDLTPIIRVENLHYAYNAESGAPIEALRGVDVQVRPGEHLAIVGRNGSGKSTLSKCLNGLLTPAQGDVWVEGQNTRDAAALLAIRSAVGMVFQNPDNQFITTSVDEEVAFGPENLGLPREALRRRVDQALARVGLDVPGNRDPRYLSAGQKAKLAIASVLAMAPRCLVLDESTAMLDPVSRQQVMQALAEVRADGITLITVTHFMNEAALADRVLVMMAGQAAALDAPEVIFGDAGLCARAGLEQPLAMRLAQGLRERGLALSDDIVSQEALVAALLACREREP